MPLVVTTVCGAGRRTLTRPFGLLLELLLKFRDFVFEFAIFFREFIVVATLFHCCSKLSLQRFVGVEGQQEGVGGVFRCVVTKRELRGVNLRQHVDRLV